MTDDLLKPHVPASRARGFAGFALWASQWVGSSEAFFIAVGATVAWAVAGHFFHWSDAWQLVANTITNVTTFIIVFLIQATQNRDARAIHLKLDEIIRALGPAHNELIDVEKLSDDDLDRLAGEYQRIREETERRKRRHPPEHPAA